MSTIAQPDTDIVLPRHLEDASFALPAAMRSTGLEAIITRPFGSKAFGGMLAFSLTESSRPIADIVAIYSSASKSDRDDCNLKIVFSEDAQIALRNPTAESKHRLEKHLSEIVSVLHRELGSVDRPISKEANYSISCTWSENGKEQNTGGTIRNREWDPVVSNNCVEIVAATLAILDRNGFGKEYHDTRNRTRSEPNASSRADRAGITSTESVEQKSNAAQPLQNRTYQFKDYVIITSPADLTIKQEGSVWIIGEQRVAPLPRAALPAGVAYKGTAFPYPADVVPMGEVVNRDGILNEGVAVVFHYTGSTKDRNRKALTGDALTEKYYQAAAENWAREHERSLSFQKYRPVLSDVEKLEAVIDGRSLRKGLRLDLMIPRLKGFQISLSSADELRLAGDHGREFIKSIGNEIESEQAALSAVTKIFRKLERKQQILSKTKSKIDAEDFAQWSDRFDEHHRAKVILNLFKNPPEELAQKQAYFEAVILNYSAEKVPQWFTDAAGAMQKYYAALEVFGQQQWLRVETTP